MANLIKLSEKSTNSGKPSLLPITVTLPYPVGPSGPSGQTVNIETTTRGTRALDVLEKICSEQGWNVNEYQLLHRNVPKEETKLFPGTRCKIIKKK